MEKNKVDHFHQQVEVQGRMVDEGMASLMEAVWGFGLQTVDCCQGGPETLFRWAWIQFPTLADGVRFLEGTGYLGDWLYADNVHIYLTPPLLPQAGPSPMVLIEPVYYLEDITKKWMAGAVRPENEEGKQNVSQ